MNAPHEEAAEFAKQSKRENWVYVGNLSYDVKYCDLIEFMRGGGLGCTYQDRYAGLSSAGGGFHGGFRGAMRGGLCGTAGFMGGFRGGFRDGFSGWVLAKISLKIFMSTTLVLITGSFSSVAAYNAEPNQQIMVWNVSSTYGCVEKQGFGATVTNNRRLVKDR